MYNQLDYLIVGSGLTGATIARTLFDKGHNVLVLDRRKHVGGNVYDHTHESGINVHTYGPHYFRTSSEEIWAFVNRFASFYPYVASIKSWVDGQHENWPIAGSYIQKNIGNQWAPAFIGKPTNFEEAALSLMPEVIYHKFIKGYNIKQWGVDPKKLSADLIKRFDVRYDDDPRLMPKHKYQGIPQDGYAELMRKMLQGIPVLMNTDYLKHRHEFSYNKMLIYTGPIDEFFEFDLGKLKYRGQVRTDSFLENQQWHQPCAQVNNPSLNNSPHIRTLEWKHIMQPAKISNIRGTLITREVTVSPNNPEEYEYPFPDRDNEQLYKQYKVRTERIPDLLICGRLGEYRYYDMDQAIGRAFNLVKTKIMSI